MERTSVVQYKVGQRVVLLADVYEQGEDLPPSLLARKGEVLVVRKVMTPTKRRLLDGGWLMFVSHEQVTDGSFGVLPGEIKPA